ncbi:MAG: type II toxin-antitoxin system VapC family toxin [Burkholderiales bacterium]
MRGAVFADSGFWIARLSPRDRLHAKARAASQEVSANPIVTTELVLTEVLNAFANSGAFVRGRAAKLVDTLSTDSQVTVIHQSPILFAQGLALYRKHSDKAWSLTDCISFAVMKSLGIKNALAHDRHFEQAGFVAMLRN